MVALIAGGALAIGGGVLFFAPVHLSEQPAATALVILPCCGPGRRLSVPQRMVLTMTTARRLFGSAAFAFAAACTSLAGLPDVPVPLEAGAEGGKSSSGSSNDASSLGSADDSAASGSSDDGGSGGDTCVPNATQCSGSIPQTCSAQGQWSSAAPCAYLCQNGACTGTCVPASKQCNGNIPQDVQ